MLPLPPDFVKRVRLEFSEDEANRFLQSLDNEPITSIRLHPRKSTQGFTQANKVAWYAQGVYLAQRPIFTLDPTFWAGAYYVQEASSMFLGEVLRQFLPAQAPKILDLCAAPGGKSSLILDCISQDSLLLSNEVIKSRVNILEENLARWGNVNYLVTNNDPEDFAKLPHFFDMVLIDAPCSGEGMFRKEDSARQEWSLENINLCSARQKRILRDIIPALKPDGYLIYSTCTYNRQENEENLHWLIEQGFESLPIQLQKDWQIVETIEKTKSRQKIYAYRLYPHRLSGEGLFMSILQKKSHDGFNKIKMPKFPKTRYEILNKKHNSLIYNWLETPQDYIFYTFEKNLVFALPQKFSQSAEMIERGLFLKKLGIFIGEIKGNDFVPSQDLAMSMSINSQVSKIELSENQALNFLRKQEINDLTIGERGWILATYQGLALGWLKNLGNRINNYYPNHWRIRM
ncbi:MAG: RNA methyltransferase [Microscillaceae bacterium]|jgi:16S rRNA C967 or C1407 C5-methylase (RsmB/RsmF family)/NOL1/NOP2/fmu family ribosome biogenesis protein|nr:RNA methyltransferase [Microscillaceae bacterium]